MTNRVSAYVLALLLVAALVACGSTEPKRTIEGTYELQTANGKPVPVTFQTSTGTYTVGKEHITILPEGKWFSFREATSTGGIGDWILSGNQVTFIDNYLSTPSFFSGTWSGDTLTTIIGTYTLVYARQ